MHKLSTDEHQTLLNNLNQSYSDLNYQLINNKKQFSQLVFSRFIFSNVLAFFLQLGGLTLSTLSSPFSPVWFASGTAFALYFLKGSKVLVGIFFATFIACYIGKGGFLLSLLFAMVSTLQLVLLLNLCCYYQINTLLFYQIKPFLKFMILTLLITAITSFILLLFSYPLFGKLPVSFFSLWCIWSFSNGNGTIFFAAIIMVLDAYFPEIDQISRKEKIIFLCYFMALLIFNIILLFCQNILITTSLILFDYFYLLLMTLFYGQFGLVIFIFSIFFLLGLGHFAETPLWQTVFFSQTIIYLDVVLLLSYFSGMAFLTKRLMAFKISTHAEFAAITPS